MILGALGRGGMGQVYRARDQESGRDVALKLLTSRLNERSRERFQREGELTARLDHPGILRVHSAGVWDERPYLVYELIEGGRTLEEALVDVDWRSGTDRLIEVCEALAYAHREGVVHRDIKPANILIDPSGAPRIGDFGLARAADLRPITRTDVLVGTPNYMAPEVFTREHELGPAVDVWSLGVILYQVLSGELPFVGPNQNVVELMALACAGDPKRPRAVDPSIPPALEAVCLACLSPEPEKRYPDAVALLADLRAAREGRPVSVHSPERLWPFSLTVAVVCVLSFLIGLVLSSRARPDRPAVVAEVQPVDVLRLLRDGRRELALAERATEVGVTPARGPSLAERRQRATAAFSAVAGATPPGSRERSSAAQGLERLETLGAPPSADLGARAAADAIWRAESHGEGLRLSDRPLAKQLEVCDAVLQRDPYHPRASSLRARLRFLGGEDPATTLAACLEVTRRHPQELDTLWRVLAQAWESEKLLAGGPWTKLRAVAAQREAPGAALVEGLVLTFEPPRRTEALAALARLDAYVERAPADPTARILRAWVALRAERLDLAERDLDLAWEIAPDSGLAALGRALLRARRGEPSEAVAIEIIQARFHDHTDWRRYWEAFCPELRPYRETVEVVARARFYHRGPGRRSPYGRLEEVTADGFAVGWVVDPDTPQRPLEVHFFLDGTPGSGATELGSVSADRPRPLVARATGCPGGHGFRYRLPASARGEAHRLHVFAIDSEQRADNPPLTGSGLRFRLR